MCVLSKKEHCIVLPHSCLVGSREPEACSFPRAFFIAMDFCSPDNFLPLWKVSVSVKQNPYLSCLMSLLKRGGLSIQNLVFILVVQLTVYFFHCLMFTSL